jgi:hypothetical protein
LGYWRKTIINSKEDGTQLIPFRLLTEEVPGQMIYQNKLHDITISPITLAPGVNQKQVPHDITVPNILARISNQKQLPHDNSVGPTSGNL